MDSKLLEILADPVDKTPLHFGNLDEESTGEVETGELLGSHGQTYAITNYIPRFVLTQDAGQLQTEESFGYKWQREQSYASSDEMDFHQDWLVSRYGFEDLSDMQRFFGSRKRILDAGCGSGYSASAWLTEDWRTQYTTDWIGVDISEAIDVARRRIGIAKNLHYVQADVLQMPFVNGAFDTIFSEGVLHHTPSTEKAIKALAPLLAPDGEFMFYVYRKKGAIREFADEHIRDAIADLPPEQAWEMLRPLTKLGEALADLKTDIDVPEDIPYLGIKAGRYDIQRFVYWHVMKLFWNETFDFEKNHHINFDWYHPQYAHRQTEAEIRQWCDEAGLTIDHFNEQESGYTVRARRVQ